MPRTPRFDLQSHSLQSDGELVPEQVVSAAAAAGVELLALSDHDSVEGLAPAGAAAREAGISLLSAVEISTAHPGYGDLHILGYAIDPSDGPLNERLVRSRGDRDTRAQRMVQNLLELGYQVDQDALQRRVAAGETLGRPHVARAVVSHPANRARLEQEGLEDPSLFLVAYLIEGRPAFTPRAAPTVKEAIDLIHGAGGMAVWAHPFWDIADPDTVLRELDGFRELGLDGVEAFYVTHDREQTKLLAEHCRNRAMFTTGSSDFHGPGHRLFNRFLAFETYGEEPDLGPLG